METVTAEYKGAQKDVLSALETAWDNYGLYIEKLTLYKPTKYVATLKADAKDRIKKARALPDLQARNGLAEELRIDVEKAAADCLNDFQLLKGYIEEAFKGDDENKRKPNFEEAGQEYYRDASRGDWESVQSLSDSMKLYITDKLGTLSTKGDMPALFQTSVNDHKEAFETVYGDFKVAEETQVATAKRVKAINACYNEGIEMMTDAQRVYAKEPEIKSLFVYATLLDMINPKTAGVRGKLQDSDTHEPLAGATGTFTPENEPAIVVNTDEEGEYGSLQMRVGTYKVKWEMTGYETVESEIEITEHTVIVRNYRMKKTTTPNLPQ